MASRAPLQLYRRILRVHRRLPADQRGLGDSYVKAEFRRHRDAKPEFVEGFLGEWASYCEMVEGQLAAAAAAGGSQGGFGRDLEAEVKSQLSEEQEQQLEQLREAVQLEATGGGGGDAGSGVRGQG